LLACLLFAGCLLACLLACSFVACLAAANPVQSCSLVSIPRRRAPPPSNGTRTACQPPAGCHPRARAAAAPPQTGAGRRCLRGFGVVGALGERGYLPGCACRSSDSHHKQARVVGAGGPFSRVVRWGFRFLWGRLRQQQRTAEGLAQQAPPFPPPSRHLPPLHPSAPAPPPSPPPRTPELQGDVNQDGARVLVKHGQVLDGGW
jgi:hypothetical protein